MQLERITRGHRFDFDSRACVVCGMTHKEFLDNKGRPACMGRSPEKPKQSKNEDDDGGLRIWRMVALCRWRFTLRDRAGQLDCVTGASSSDGISF